MDLQQLVYCMQWIKIVPQFDGCVVDTLANLYSHFSSTSLVGVSLGLSAAPWQPTAGDDSTLEWNVGAAAVRPSP